MLTGFPAIRFGFTLTLDHRAAGLPARDLADFLHRLSTNAPKLDRLLGDLLDLDRLAYGTLTSWSRLAAARPRWGSQLSALSGVGCLEDVEGGQGIDQAAQHMARGTQ